MLSEANNIIEVPAGTNVRADAEKNFWSNLKWHCLFCLLEQEGHLAISALAQKSGLSVVEAVRALESMEMLGAVKKTENGYAQVQDFFKRVGTTTSQHIEIISQYVLSSAQVNNRILETIETGKHKTKCITYNSTQELANELYEKIQKAVDEFKQKSDAAKPKWDGVYNLSASIIEMTSEA